MILKLHLGKNKPIKYEVSEERRIDHIPSTQHYAVEEVFYHSELS